MSHWIDVCSHLEHHIDKQKIRFFVRDVDDHLWKFETLRPTRCEVKFFWSFQKLWKKKPRKTAICISWHFLLPSLEINDLRKPQDPRNHYYGGSKHVHCENSGQNKPADENLAEKLRQIWSKHTRSSRNCRYMTSCVGFANMGRFNHGCVYKVTATD